MAWPWSRTGRAPWRLLRALVTALEGIRTELTALRILQERGPGSVRGSVDQDRRAFMTSVPQPDAPMLKIVKPEDLMGSLIQYQEAQERLTEALGREPDDEEVIAEVERSSA